QRLLEAPRAIQRGGPPEPQDVPDFVGDLDPALAAHFLLDQLHGKQRREVLGADGLPGARGQHRRRRGLEIGLDVVPLRWQVLLAQDDLGFALVATHGGLLADVGRHPYEIAPTIPKREAGCQTRGVTGGSACRWARRRGPWSGCRARGR